VTKSPRALQERRVAYCRIDVIAANNRHRAT